MQSSTRPTEEFNSLYANLVLFGEAIVTDAAGEIVNELAGAGHTLAVLVRDNPQTPRPELWMRDYDPHRSDVISAQSALVVAMRKDLGVDSS